MGGTASLEATRRALLAADSPEAMREAVKNAGKPPAAVTKPEDVLLHAFNVTDRTVQPERMGRFVSEVPTDAIRMEMAGMRAVLLRGASWQSLTPDEQELIDCHILCTWCLKEKPTWYTDTMGARLPMVTISVGRVIREHHAQFFRVHTEYCGATAERPIVEITALVGTEVPAAIAR